MLEDFHLADKERDFGVLSVYCLGFFYLPLWRNWQTHTTQNRTGNHVGSTPTSGTIGCCSGILYSFWFGIWAVWILRMVL